MTKYYISCDELFMHNFSKILDTNNYAWLVVGYDGYEDVKFDEVEASNIWQDIYYEYCKLTEDNKSLLYFAVVQELVYLKTRKEVASTLLQQLKLGIDDEILNLRYIEALKDWKYRIDVKRLLEDELERMYLQLRQSDNKINIKQAELDDLKVDDSEKLTIIEQTVKLEQALSRNEIDLKRTVVTKYIAMFKEVKLLNEARKKNNGK
jgi:hypothetical protein